jgi:hypothetical protein
MKKYFVFNFFGWVSEEDLPVSGPSSKKIDIP